VQEQLEIEEEIRACNEEGDGDLGTEDEWDPADNGLPLHDQTTPLSMRANLGPFRIWYRTNTDDKWKQGSAEYLQDNWMNECIRWQRGGPQYSNIVRHMTVNEYMTEARGSYIRDDDPALDAVCPVRKEYQLQARKEAEVLGNKRIQTKYSGSGSKAVLEVGDYVTARVSHKFKTSHGDKQILATVHEQLPHKKYRILTHAGVLTKKYARNELTFDPQFDAEHLSIPAQLAMLPRITEGDALSLINPMRKTAVFCNCKKVTLPTSSAATRILTLYPTRGRSVIIF
jgi:hypothetical protein